MKNAMSENILLTLRVPGSASAISGGPDNVSGLRRWRCDVGLTMAVLKRKEAGNPIPIPDSQR